MFSSLPKDLYYLLLTAVLIGAMVVLIPRQAIKSLLPSALVFGSLGSLIFVLLFSNLLKLYYYSDYGAFHTFQIPIWVILSWAPTILIFLYFLPWDSGKIWFWAYLLIFSAFSAGLGMILNNLGLLHYIHWGPIPRFLLAVFWFYLAARFTPENKLF